MRSFISFAFLVFCILSVLGCSGGSGGTSSNGQGTDPKGKAGEITISNRTSDLSIQVKTEDSKKELLPDNCISLSANQLKSARLSYRPSILNQRWILHCADNSDKCDSAGWWEMCKEEECYTGKKHYEINKDRKLVITQEAPSDSCPSL